MRRYDPAVIRERAFSRLISGASAASPSACAAASLRRLIPATPWPSCRAPNGDHTRPPRRGAPAVRARQPAAPRSPARAAAPSTRAEVPPAVVALAEGPWAAPREARTSRASRRSGAREPQKAALAVALDRGARLRPRRARGHAPRASRSAPPGPVVGISTQSSRSRAFSNSTRYCARKARLECSLSRISRRRARERRALVERRPEACDQTLALQLRVSCPSWVGGGRRAVIPAAVEEHDLVLPERALEGDRHDAPTGSIRP